MDGQGYTLHGEPISANDLAAHFNQREDRWGGPAHHPLDEAREIGSRVGAADRESGALTLPDYALVDELTAQMKFLKWDPEIAARDVFSSYLSGHDDGGYRQYGLPKGWAQERRERTDRLWARYGAEYEKKEFRQEGERAPRLPEAPKPKGAWAAVQSVRSYFQGPESPLQQWSRALGSAEERGHEKGEVPRAVSERAASPRLSEKSAAAATTTPLSPSAPPSATQRSVAVAARRLLPPTPSGMVTGSPSSTRTGPPPAHLSSPATGRRAGPRQ